MKDIKNSYILQVFTKVLIDTCSILNLIVILLLFQLNERALNDFEKEEASNQFKISLDI